MQRIACRDFAGKMGWTIVIEKEEKSVFGFKVPANIQDAIQDLRDGELDIRLCPQ